MVLLFLISLKTKGNSKLFTSRKNIKIIIVKLTLE